MDLVDDVLLLLWRQLRVDRQREGVTGRTLGLREVAYFVTEIGKALLEMEGNGIVDLRPHAAIGQKCFQLVATTGPDHELVIDVAAAALGIRHGRRLDDTAGGEARLGQKSLVATRILLTSLGPSVEIVQLHVDKGRLQGIESEVAADEAMVVLRFGAVGPQHSEALGQSRVVRDDHASVTERTEVLGGEEGEGADRAEAAGAASVAALGADRLRCILE